MYKLEYQPSAMQDLVEIVLYISGKLKAPDTAEKLSEKLIAGCEEIVGFPYANPVFTPQRPLKYEYRKAAVQNYLILYRVDEQSKTVTVSRAVYARREEFGIEE